MTDNIRKLLESPIQADNHLGLIHLAMNYGLEQLWNSASSRRLGIRDLSQFGKFLKSCPCGLNFGKFGLFYNINGFISITHTLNWDWRDYNEFIDFEL